MSSMLPAFNTGSKVGYGVTIDVHGNPNAVTKDAGTSTLAQGYSAHSCLVEVEKYTGALPPVTVFKQPATVECGAVTAGEPGRGLSQTGNDENRYLAYKSG
jgi:hypothetical protein